MEKKTVAHIVSVYLRVTENWIYTQLASLKRYQAVVLTHSVENAGSFPHDAVYSVSSLGMIPRYCNKACRRLSGYVPFWADAMRSRGCSAMHAHFGMEGYYNLPLKRKSRVPLVTSFYGIDMTRLPRIKRWAARFRVLFAEGELFLAEGACAKRHLVALGCPEEKIKIQHLGRDVERIPFARRVRPEGEEIRILIAGRFTEKKGIPFGIRAFARVRERFRDATLTIIGDGEMRGEIKGLISRLKISDAVRMLGAQPYPVFLEEAMRSHIFLSPSVTAKDGDAEGGAPVAIIDAQATGLPVVATYHADIPEVVLDGITGHLVRERDAEALSEKMLALIENPHAWGEMGIRARRHVEENYCAGKQAKKLEDIYDRIIIG